MTFISFSRLMEALILPPGGPLLLALVGLLLLRVRHRLAIGLISGALLVLYLASIPLLSINLVKALELGEPLDMAALPSGPGAIVVIAGPDSYFNAPEYDGGDTAGPAMLARLRYAARLQRASGLPLVVLGGDGLGRGTPAAGYMREILEQEFQVPVGWSNGASHHTFDNAHYARQELVDSGISHVYLVTHAWHMRRAAAAFEHAGLRVTPAPTQFATPGEYDLGPLGLVPTADALLATRWALHELIGLMLAGWYGD